MQLDWITHPLVTDALFVCGVGACTFLFYSLKKEIYLIRERWLLSIAALSSALETTDERLARLRSEFEKVEAANSTAMSGPEPAHAVVEPVDSLHEREMLFRLQRALVKDTSTEKNNGDSGTTTYVPRPISQARSGPIPEL
ncbi:MAG: hypothetical protein U0Q18_08180 [Bryobacteraceae bacterium]